MFDLLNWRDTTVPYRPGVAHTQGFGLRVTNIGSPFHLGNDRGRGPRDILAPFDGEMIWSAVDGVAGSVMQLIPDDARGYVELQVFHTVAPGEHISFIRSRVRRGDKLSVVAGDIGLSHGVHTHTELVVNGDTVVEDNGEPLYRSGTFNELYIKRHCGRHGLDYGKIMQALTEQVQTWRITYMSTQQARRTVPSYREPHWGPGETLHVDPYWLLQI